MEIIIVIKMKRKRENKETKLKNRIKVQLQMERRKEWKKKLRCSELYAVEAGFMVGRKDSLRLIPSLSNCRR